MCWLISFVCSLLICSLQHAEAIVACPPTTTCARTQIAWHRLLVGVLVLCALRGAVTSSMREKSTGHSMHVVLHCIFPRVFLSARQVFASVSSLVTVAVCIVYTCHIVGYCTQVRHMLQHILLVRLSLFFFKVVHVTPLQFVILITCITVAVITFLILFTTSLSVVPSFCLADSDRCVQ